MDSRFLFSWSVTRSRRRFLVGLPCIALSVAGILLWTNRETSEQINGRYEAALTKAIHQHHDADLEVAVHRLQHSHVDTFAIRFRRAQNLISAGKNADAIPILKALTPPDGQGHVPARIWLVKQSERADALVPLVEEERQQQLRKAVQEHRQNPEAHLLLGKSYLRQRQFRLAEFHFATAAKLDPKHAADLLALQQALGRSRPQLTLQSAAAMQKLKDRLSDDQGDRQVRISIARIMAILGDTKQAESILKAGLAIEESTDVKHALSVLYAGMAIDLLRQPLHQRQAADLGLQAVLLDPANTSAIQLLFQTVQPTGTITAITLGPATDHWRRQLEQDSTSVPARMILMQLLTVCGLFDEAIEVLKPVASANLDSQASLARLFVLARRMDEARVVTDGLLHQLRSGTSDNERVVVSVARVLLIENRLQEVVDLLETQITSANRVPGSELASIYVRSINALFDQKAAADDSFVGSNESLKLLQRVYRISPGAESIAPRLAKIAVGQGVAAPEANALVLKILAQGTLNAIVYSAVGAEAILQDDLEQAVANLQQAQALSPNDPVALNNLAVALVRQSKDNADRALDLVQQALTIAPGHHELLATRGEIYISLNRLTEARDDLLTVLNRIPQHKLSLHLLAGITD